MATVTADGRNATSTADGFPYRRFRPRLVLGYQRDLTSLVKELTAMGLAEARTALDTAIGSLDEKQSALQAFGLAGLDLAPTIR